MNVQSNEALTREVLSLNRRIDIVINNIDKVDAKVQHHIDEIRILDDKIHKLDQQLSTRISVIAKQLDKSESDVRAVYTCDRCKQTMDAVPYFTFYSKTKKKYKYDIYCFEKMKFDAWKKMFDDV